MESLSLLGNANEINLSVTNQPINMKRNLFRLPFPLILFALIMLDTARLSAQEAYAVFTANDSTLTFYYDELKAERNGDKYTLNVSHGSPEWYSRRKTIVQVVFDDSFVEARPTTTSAWFVGMANLRDIVGIENLKTDNVTDMSGMFWGCSSLTSLDASGFNTANVVFMGGMFKDCSSLTSLDVSGFNTSSVIDIGEMFYKCSSLTSLDVSGFNTEKACDMVNMFYGCSSLTHLDLSGFDTKNVTDMYHMFAYCSSLVSLDISHFNTRNVTSMLQMFEGCKKLTTLDLSSFVTDNVEYMSGMFYNCTKLSTVYVSGGWNTDNLTTPTEEMFRFCNNLVGGAGTTYNSSHLDAEYASIDGGAESPGYFTQKPREAYAVLSTDSTSVTFFYDDLRASRVSEGAIIEISFYNAENKPEWATENLVSATFDESFAAYDGLTSLSCWFYDCENLSSVDGLSNLCSDFVTDMSDMFNGCSSLTSLDLSNLNTENVIDLSYMFCGCSSLTKLDISHFDTQNVTDMHRMFMLCSKLTSLDISSFITCEVKNMENMFGFCSALTDLDLNNFNTDKVTDMGGMFEMCVSLKSINLSNFNTKQVQSMAYMFNQCSSLANLDLSSFSTESVTEMNFMFYRCASLIDLDLSSFGTRNVRDMTNMFRQCLKLNTIYVSDVWSIDLVSNSSDMFTTCTNLIGGAGTVYDINHVDAEYARIDGGVENPGYFTRKYTLEPYAVLSNDGDSVSFYYDGLKNNRKGIIIDLPFSNPYPPDPYPWANSNLVNATFDATFSNYHGLTSLYSWFNNCRNMTSIDGIENLNTENVTVISYMFASCRILTNIDLSHFNTKNVKLMQGVFAVCTSLKSLDLRQFNTYNTISMDNMFEGCSALTSLDVSGFNTEKVEDMHNMFMGCSSLIELDISHFNTENVTAMGNMFSYCSSLTNLDLSNFNTENVISMASMFQESTNLSNLDLSSFNTEKVENMHGMFNGCFALTTVYVGNHWNTSFVTSSDFMFDSCTYLRGGNGTLYNESNPQDKTYARIDDPDNGQPGYFTAKYVGDVNGDSSVNVSDVTSLVGIILGNSEPNSAADVNKDGEVNVSDVTAIVSIILGND